jgi:hypothetical protein
MQNAEFGLRNEKDRRREKGERIKGIRETKEVAGSGLRVTLGLLS